MSDTDLETQALQLAELVQGRMLGDARDIILGFLLSRRRDEGRRIREMRIALEEIERDARSTGELRTVWIANRAAEELR